MENQETIKNTFSPSKSYTWQPETKFPLSGNEFGMMYKYVLEFLTSPYSPSTTMKMSEVFAIIQSKLKVAVEAGEATELQKEEPVTMDKPMD